MCIRDSLYTELKEIESEKLFFVICCFFLEMKDENHKTEDCKEQRIYCHDQTDFLYRIWHHFKTPVWSPMRAFNKNIELWVRYDWRPSSCLELTVNHHSNSERFNIIVWPSNSNIQVRQWKRCIRVFNNLTSWSNVLIIIKFCNHSSYNWSCIKSLLSLA